MFRLLLYNLRSNNIPSVSISHRDPLLFLGVRQALHVCVTPLAWLLFTHSPPLGLSQCLLLHLLSFLLRGTVPVTGHVQVVTKQITNLFQRATFGLGKQEVLNDNVDRAGNNEDQVKLPADAIQGDRSTDKRHFTCEIESRQTQCDAVGPKMVGENLGNVDVLGCVDEEAPPKYVLFVKGLVTHALTKWLIARAAPGSLTKKTKNTAALSPAVLSVSKKDAVRAQRKIRETTQPMEPISINRRLPNRSMYKAVQVLPMMVKLVQQALRRRGVDPDKPREA